MTVLVFVTLLALGSLALTAQPAAAQEQQENATLPISYPPTVLEGDSESCASIEEREMARTQICEDISGNLRDVVIPSFPCGGPGWTLAASLDMTDPTQNCPSAWDEQTRSGKRVCFRQPSGSGSCDSVTFSTDGKEYTHVCGRAIGYQYASADCFAAAPHSTIDSYYVDGLSVTHGQPGDRTHIWTFAVGLSEVHAEAFVCPCVHPANIALVPSYVATNYFCESGLSFTDTFSFGTLYTADPLWDGDGCGAPNNNCCSFNSPPWFTVELPNPTTDDIEVRNCANQNTNDEDTGIELIEFYIR